MSKYFKTKEQEEKLLSEYWKISTEPEKKEISYLIDILGDIALDEDMMDLFHKQFHRFGGKYSVRTKPETFQGIYDFTRKFPELSSNAIDEVWFRYIRDLFEEYDIPETLVKYFEVFGRDDETFELFIDYVDKKSDKHQKQYEEEVKQLDELKDEYSDQFITHLKSLVTREHISSSEIKKYLPAPELIQKDEQHILDLSRQTRIFFGCCKPVSYTMFDILVEEKTLDTFTETPTYYISTGRQEQATFTKTEFLESIKKDKIRVKK